MPPSRLADRDMARVGTTLNTLLDRLTEDRARVRRLAAQVISAQDEERARVARELHDSTAQMLAAVMLQLGVAAQESTSPALDERIATLRDMAAEALEEVRTLSHTIHPRVLDDLGLAAALEWLARQTREQESLDVRGVRRRRAARSRSCRPRCCTASRRSRCATRCATRRRDASSSGCAAPRPRRRSRWWTTAAASTCGAPRNGDPGWDCSPCASAWGW